jgi:glutathione S-transferase
VGSALAVRLKTERATLLNICLLIYFSNRKYPSGKKLIPEGNEEVYGRFEQACSVEQSYFAAAAETIGTELVIKPYVYLAYLFLAALPTYQLMCGHARMKGLGAPDEARAAQAEQDLDAVLAVYDKILASQKYIAGDELTLADLFHLPNGAALMAGKWKEIFKKYPNAEKWFRGLQERETWVKAAKEAGTIP